MSNINEEHVVEFIREVLPKKEGLLKELEDYAEENSVPIVEPETAQFLDVLIKKNKPLKILELGTAIGYSSIRMAQAFEGSSITTIEIREDMAELARENIKKAGLETRIEVILGDAREVLKELDDHYDLIFLDAAKGQYIVFFDLASNLLKEKGIIVSDNVLFKGMVTSDDLVIRRKKTIVKRLRTYLEYINHIDGYTSCILPLGDGVAITYKD